MKMMILPVPRWEICYSSFLEGNEKHWGHKTSLEALDHGIENFVCILMSPKKGLRRKWLANNMVQKGVFSGGFWSPSYMSSSSPF